MVKNRFGLTDEQDVRRIAYLFLSKSLEKAKKANAARRIKELYKELLYLREHCEHVLKRIKDGSGRYVPGIKICAVCKYRVSGGKYV